MSALTKVLAEQMKSLHEDFPEKIKGGYRLTHHLMPPVGWLNDPNGLCFFQGRYHVFFQYSPFEVQGGLKFWGHYSSENLTDWKFEGVPLCPDTPMDCHGVYSGSALVDGDTMHLFYTGNVKLEDGTYDYINDGRRSSTIHVESRDGIHFGKKEEVLGMDQYPDAYTCHIRDPKVWKQGEGYRMILGGRKKNGQGAVLFYISTDKKHWKFDREMTTEEPLGYMWECPDYFTLGDAEILSVSPQGVVREKYRHQNIYLSGYFPVKEGQVVLEDFREWDMGFDFYAPQTFLDEKGRRILIGWMGMPDAEEEYVNPTLEEGWQHCLTVPRELSLRNDKVYQYPVEELKKLRTEEQKLSGQICEIETSGPFDLEMKTEGGDVQIVLEEVFRLEYRNGKILLAMEPEAGAGRGQRKALLSKVSEVRILADTSALEIYLNQGEMVFSSRYYGKNEKHKLYVKADKAAGSLWKTKAMEIQQ